MTGVLTNENHERYARLRAILVPPRAAVKAIGMSAKSGAASKLEHNDQIKARIAELVAIEEDVLREKRTQIESALSAIAYGDGSEFPGKRIPIAWTDRRGAMDQLRDMHGFKAPAKTELTGKNGEALVPSYTPAERAAALQLLIAKLTTGQARAA